MNLQITAAIVVPCFNEANRLDPDTYRNFISSHPEIIFVFVNDGSCDTTAEILKKTVDGTSSRIISLDHNTGKAEAVRRGMLEAQKYNCICGFWDADLATPLSEIPPMIAELQKTHSHCVIGSRRRLPKGNHIKRNWFRHIAGRFFAISVSLLLKRPIYDSQCGAKLFSAEAAAAIFPKKFKSRWLFDVEIIQRLQQQYGTQTPSLIEYPLNHWEETAGSKLCFRHIVSDFFHLLRS